MTAQDPYCLYVKLYCDPQRHDEIIVSSIRPLVERLSNRFSCRSWFFVRYKDKRGHHLRIRFLGDRSLAHGNQRRELLQHLASVAQRERGYLQIARYRPEYRRYGGKTGVRLSERVFDSSSRFVCAFLRQKLRKRIMVSRFEAALAGIEAILRNLGFSSAQVATWHLHRAASYRYRPELLLSDFSAPQREQLLKTVRRIDGEIGKGLASLWAKYPSLQRHLDTFCRDIRDYGRQCRRYGRLILRPPVELATAHVHIHLNRLGVCANREASVLLLHLMAYKRRDRSAEDRPED